ncbi:hypothetical protein FKG94_09770 [Exilibacterium tricleocarpae]|uniref:PasA protein n=1 Tax=Exilibacterium tricleocarpae TaxID=2591008 RepID=A0A545TVV9_9GAMM|nr:DUF6586 family protein [Exilibacterium tricleocarpae]TQV81368.1 hypothetical protein FKG94_09770 [Exilibacterium tricleocarpae]
MSNPYLPRVNRALAYVKVQLDAVDRAAATPPDQGLHIEAALNAAVLQLWLALQLYWHEIAGNYRIREPVPTLEGLLVQLDRASLAAAEAHELQTLAATEGSWLADLTRWQRELIPGSESSPAVTTGAIKTIASVNLDRAPPEVAQLRHCLAAMKELLERQRQGMAEY